MYVEEMCVDVIKKNKFLESLKQALYLTLTAGRYFPKESNPWFKETGISIEGNKQGDDCLVSGALLLCTV